MASVLVRKIAATLVLALSGLAVSAGVTPADSPGATPAGARTLPHCLVPHGAGPGYNASIGNSQNGKTVCIAVGEKLLVLLSGGSPNASPWRAVHVSKPGILKIAPLTLMLTRGLTGTNFRAVRVGTVRLTSERSPCVPTTPAGARCNVIEIWQATVVVRGPVA